MINHFPYTNFHELNLDWIVSTMKQISTNIDDINSWKESWTVEFEDIKDIIDELNSKYLKLESDYQEFINTINANFDTLENQIDARFDTLENRINIDFQTQKQEISNRISTLEAETFATLSLMNSRINEMDLKLTNVLNNLLDNVMMTNPFTGIRESVVNVINTLASLHMLDGISAEDYDALDLTATYYDAKELTATDYDFNASNLLP